MNTEEEYFRLFDEASIGVDLESYEALESALFETIRALNIDPEAEHIDSLALITLEALKNPELGLRKVSDLHAAPYSEHVLVLAGIGVGSFSSLTLSDVLKFYSTSGASLEVLVASGRPHVGYRVSPAGVYYPESQSFGVGAQVEIIETQLPSNSAYVSGTGLPHTLRL